MKHNWEAIEGEKFAPVHEPYSERYTVSNFGRIFQNRNGSMVLMSQTRGTVSKGKPGYMKASLVSSDGVRKLLSVHRIVARAFVPGSAENMDVNHKDLDKTNNVWTNLEWVTHAENVRHGMENNFDWRDRLAAAARKRAIPIIAKDAAGVETRYDSGRHAARALGNVNRAANICNACQMGFKWYGLEWRYA